MRRYQRVLVIALAAVIVAAGLSVGLVKAYAQGESALAAVTPAELLTRMVDSGSTPTAVSGDIGITNNLLGTFPAEFSLGGGGPAALVQSGSGRMWVQDGKARLEAQGMFNDTVLYFDGEKATLYDSTANTLTVYSLPDLTAMEAAGEEAGADRPSFDPQTAIPQMIESMAPVATLAVAGQEQIAGRDCYVLTLTPAAENTLFGYVSVAVDGQTYLPLQVAIFAKASTEPVFLAGFTSISYDPIDDSIFEVPSPAGAKVEEKQLQLPFDRMSMDASAGEAAEKAHAALEPLTVEEASAKAGYAVLAAQTTDPAYAFQGAYVFDVPEEMLGALSGSAGAVDGAASPTWADPDDADTTGGEPADSALGTAIDAAEMLKSPIVVQIYGDGFGTVVMVQAKTASLGQEALQSMLAQLPFIQETAVNDAVAFQFATPLLSLMGWQQEIQPSTGQSGGPGAAQQDAVTLIVAGSVSSADLSTFAASVR
jgi:outer membrane lipoprotein-sorting protein